VNRQYGALSGVAVVLIVLNHAIHFSLQVSPIEGPWLNVLIFLQALGAFAVPIFLFISGAFLAYAASSLSLTFIRSSLGRILWPYLIWSAIFYVLVLLALGERYAITGYVKNLLVGYPYHFVPLLIFWYVAAPLVVRFGRRHGVLLLAAIGLYQIFLLGMRDPAMFGVAHLPDWLRFFRPPVLFRSMSDWAIYFPLGLVLSMHDAALKPRLIRLRWLAVAATAVLFVLGILDAFGMMVAPWARFAAPVPLMFVLPTIDRRWVPSVRHFELLGKRSYGVYLSHFVFINLIVFLVVKSRLGLGGHAALLLFPVFFVLALGSALLLMEGMTKATPARRVYRYMFGIVPPVAGAQRRPT
jgi:surface polysaccharide O-acyltransferase-like enzyme